jgi:ADP-heptose:LPS heptosyltransferase
VLAGESGPFVLHPGSGWPIKNWLPSRWGQAAATITRRYGVAPLVTGGPGEGALVRAVVDASGGRARGLAGRLSLGGLAALFRRARVVIATDGGPLHLAAMLGAPVVGLYGPADPIEFGPWCYADRRRIVRVHLPCSPCRTLDRPPCGEPTEPRCIRGITTEAVLDAITDLLGAGDRRRAS